MTLKNYLRLGVLLLIIVLGSWALIATKRAQSLQAEAARQETNFLNSAFEITHLKTKLGEKAAQVNGLTVTTKELEQVNASLAKRITDLGVKLKHAQLAIKIVMQYETTIDTLFLDTLSRPHSFGYADKWIRLKGFYNEQNRYKIDSLQLGIKDDILIVPTVEGKWWQCRKKWRIAVRIHSENPYNTIDKIEYYKFTKK